MWTDHIPKQPVLPGDDDEFTESNPTTAEDDPPQDEPLVDEEKEDDQDEDIIEESVPLSVPVQRQPQLWQQGAYNRTSVEDDDGDYSGTIIMETPDIIQDSLTSVMVLLDPEETCDM